MLVIVDVLSFSTSVAAAVSNGVQIVPCREQDEPTELADRFGATLAVHRKEVPDCGRYSLSPLTYRDAPAGERVVLPSPNGATCSHWGSMASAIFVGSLVNAVATAEAVLQAHEELGRPVSVIACGERQAGATAGEEIRFALEDYLGAGAILSVLPADRSPEAELCAGAFKAAHPCIVDLIWECESGIELRNKGYADDVRFSAALDRFGVAARLVDGVLTPCKPLSRRRVES